MKFIGHLDIMRFFQKVMRRADIPIAFTGGFSPHMIMSFANPLGVGVTSDGEYFDIELTEDIDMKQTGMSIVAAADYLSSLKSGIFPEDWKEKAGQFMNQPTISILKKTKKSEKEVDIKPMIYKFEVRGESVYTQVATGSVENLKPELVMQALSSFLGVDLETVSFAHHRLDVYANIGTEEKKEFVSLDQVTE